MTSEQLIAYFDRISEAPDAIPRLRQFILDLAIRGKLVDQNPDDGSVFELLNGIDARRSSILRISPSGPQAPAPIKDGEIRFDVPVTWRWTPLSTLLFSSFYGPRFGSDEYSNDGIPTIRTTDMTSDGRIVLRNPPKVNIPADRLHNFKCENGDLLITRTGSIGTMAVFRGDYTAIPSAYLIRLRFVDSNMAEYIHTVLRSPYGLSELGLHITKVAQPNINAKNLSAILIPLPPQEEQHRILAKIDELMRLCDRLQSAQSNRETRRDTLVTTSLHHLTNGADPGALREHARFYFNHLPRLTVRKDHIQQLRESVLSLAVRGKLVPQDPGDESGTELLKRIAAVKSQLVHGRALRRENRLPPIREGDEPFSIPPNWHWVRIGALALLVEYGTSVKSHNVEKGVPVLKMGDIQGGKVLLGGQKRVAHEIDELPQLFLKRFDLLYNRTNSAELVGKTGIYLGHDDAYTFASYLIRIRFLNNLTSPVYTNLAMNARYFRETQILPELQQQCGQANVNGSKLRNMMIPLPPLAEQYRIVAKVDELMTLCDKLEAQNLSIQTESARFLEAILADTLKSFTDPFFMKTDVATSPTITMPEEASAAGHQPAAVTATPRQPARTG